MPSPEDVITRDSRSYSQLSTYLGCPRDYQLSKVIKIKRRPGAWFPAGTAVHATIERYLRDSLSREGDE
jgi:hypothetical protein